MRYSSGAFVGSPENSAGGVAVVSLSLFAVFCEVSSLNVSSSGNETVGANPPFPALDASDKAVLFAVIVVSDSFGDLSKVPYGSVPSFLVIPALFSGVP